MIDRVTESIAQDSIMGKAVTLHLEGPPVNKIKKPEVQKVAKEMEMQWNISDEDLEKKFFRIKELLESKIPVVLIITCKRKAFEIPEAEGQKVLDKIWWKVSQIRGIQEVVPREGEPGKTMTLFLNIEAKH